ncbi:hypothetical protein BKA65DRAFT_518181 [Rhexocercosporidium sp. MPI-PUGE-AT-0058]|nr:hypothetical protein BKA65DRAFT_518181 [Rhexocercosporidium sp. MPI-PUGE-AT-0058]
MAMTAYSGTMSASLNVPHSQNTAPVLEFRCLYTADVRRKQKRWQDGRLKFHTFNKRVMVYDEKSNFVGDTHWKGGLDFEEGEELELERGGILVEVGECIGRRDQDLTELVDKRVKEREGRVAAKIAHSSPSASFLRAQATPSGPAHLRPKPLNAMLTPSGHYGRAVVPNTSPFEERQAANRDENEPPAKRRRQHDASSSKNGYAQNLMGATLSLSSSKPSSTPIIRYEPFKARSIQQSASEAIDLTNDDEQERRASDARRRIAKEQRAAIERPPPRQKNLKRSPPAKGGYASNLTGTPLMLSRSDLTPAARTMMVKAQVQQRNFENEGSTSETEGSSAEAEPPPKRVSQLAKKPAVVQPSHQGIEESSEEEDWSMEIEPPPIVATEMASKPKVSSSNAIDQVGSISSTDEEEDSLIEVEPPPKKMPNKAAKTSKESTTLSRALEQATSSAVDSSPKRPSKMPKLQKVIPATKPMGALQANQSFQSLSSSPPRKVSTPLLQCGGSVNTSAVQKSSAVEPTLDRPMSALRIKSRPARKMMMLMNRPIPRPSASNISFESSRLTDRSSIKPTIGSNEVVLSQATIKLNAFCEKQQAELEARLSRTGSKPHLEDILSSDSDSGIDHQTVDLLLSRRVQPVQKQADPTRPVVPTPSLVDKRKSPNKPTQVPAGKRPAVSHELCTDVEDHGSSQTKEDASSLGSTSARNHHVMLNSEPSEPTPPIGKNPELKIDNSISGVASSVSKEVSSASQLMDEIAIPALETSDNLSRDLIKETRASKEPATTLGRLRTERLPATDVHKPLLEPGKTEGMAISNRLLEDEPDTADPEVLMESNAQDVKTDMQSSHGHGSLTSDNISFSNGESQELTTLIKPGGQTREQPSITPIPHWKAVEVREDVGGSMQSSTARFRAMISPSTPARKSPPRTSSPPIDLASHSVDPLKGEPATSEAAVMPVTMAAPKPLTHAEEALQGRPEPCIGPGFSSAGTSAALGTPDLAGDNARRGPPRARLANPATRGKSLQTLAASTVDTMNPLFNPMPPPVPRISLRTERSVTSDESSVDRASEGLREAPADGPWSREAFDLFGLQGPPRAETRPGIPAT